VGVTIEVEMSAISQEIKVYLLGCKADSCQLCKLSHNPVYEEGSLNPVERMLVDSSNIHLSLEIRNQRNQRPSCCPGTPVVVAEVSVAPLVPIGVIVPVCSAPERGSELNPVAAVAVSEDTPLKTDVAETDDST